MSEQQSSEEGGEGLSAAEWKRVEDASWSGGARAWKAEINRILAGRLAAAHAERDVFGREGDRLRRDWVDMRSRAESAEAAHAGLVAGVEALADELDACDEHGNPLREGSLGEAADELRAALATLPTEPDAVDVEALLSEHWFIVRNVVPGSRWVGCKCGWQQPEDNRNQQRHNAHLAAALLAKGAEPHAGPDEWIGHPANLPATAKSSCLAGGCEWGDRKGPECCSPAEPDAGEVDRLAAMLHVCYLGLPRTDAHERAAAAILASPWLAALLAEARAGALREAAERVDRSAARMWHIVATATPDEWRAKP